jgi:DNA polymerase (family 10)
MDNKTIANILYETADLLEVANEDPFRIRSYRRAAEAIEAQPQRIADIVTDEKALLAIPGIGKGMAANLKEMFAEGKLRLHAELLKRYHPSMLELLKIQGLGPKTIALIWRGKALQRRKAADAPAHGRKERAEDPAWDRGLPTDLRPLHAG